MRYIISIALVLILTGVSSGADKALQAQVRMLQAQLEKQGPTIAALHEAVRKLRKQVAVLKEENAKMKENVALVTKQELSRAKVGVGKLSRAELRKPLRGPLRVGKYGRVSGVFRVTVLPVRKSTVECRGLIHITVDEVVDIVRDGKKIGERKESSPQWIHVRCTSLEKLQRPFRTNRTLTKTELHGPSWLASNTFIVIAVEKVQIEGILQTEYVLEPLIKAGE